MALALPSGLDVGDEVSPGLIGYKVGGNLADYLDYFPNGFDSFHKARILV